MSSFYEGIFMEMFLICFKKKLLNHISFSCYVQQKYIIAGDLKSLSLKKGAI